MNFGDRVVFIIRQDAAKMVIQENYTIDEDSVKVCGLYVRIAKCPAGSEQVMHWAECLKKEKLQQLSDHRISQPIVSASKTPTGVNPSLSFRIRCQKIASFVKTKF